LLSYLDHTPQQLMVPEWCMRA